MTSTRMATMSRWSGPMPPGRRRIQQRSSLPYLTPGASVLDVGCGPGQHHLRFRRHSSAPGSVTGLDRSPDVIAQASRPRRRARRARTSSFAAGNIYDLDFEDETFDVVHAHQVLQHLTDPVEALREMRRVAKPGGIVAVRDADFHGMSWYPAIPELDEWMELYQRIARRNGAEPDAGRRLVSWAQAAGFTDVAPTSSNWLYATGQQRRWQARVWGERVLHSAFADQALEYGFANAGGPGPDLGGLAPLGIHGRRLVPDPQRRSHRPGLSTDSLST